jgi:hydroxymethylpyrimidine/phosphomethylpyrimidine kinase
MHTALTIAGSDSGGGAGIQADLKSFQANGVFGMSVITAITAQNTQEVTGAWEVPLFQVQAQLDALVADLPIGAIKTGMLASRDMIGLVANFLHAHPHIPAVVDPVMVAKSGFSLIADEAVESVTRLLLPHATVLTPNTLEASRLLGRPVRTLVEAREAARALGDLGARAVLVKGGHLDDQDEAIDVLWDGAAWHTFAAPRVFTQHTHGTGCTTAAAIAANLAKGLPLVTAVERAKRYVHGAIAHALPLGGGHGPTHHFWFLEGTGLFPADDRREV